MMKLLRRDSWEGGELMRRVQSSAWMILRIIHHILWDNWRKQIFTSDSSQNALQKEPNRVDRGELDSSVSKRANEIFFMSPGHSTKRKYVPSMEGQKMYESSLFVVRFEIESRVVVDVGIRPPNA